MIYAILSLSRQRDGTMTAADLGEFNPQPWLGNKGIRVLDRSARLLAVAAQMALTGAGLSQEGAESGDPEPGQDCGQHFPARLVRLPTKRQRARAIDCRKRHRWLP